MIQIDLIEILLKRLKSTGWIQNGGYAIRENPRVLDRFGIRIAVVKPIRIDPFKILQDEIDKFFTSLISIIKKNGIKNIFLPGGGPIPIPQFFLDFCRENGINITVVTDENIDSLNSF
ncbi:hypothetical protein GCM10022389_19540 [Flavobacterium cheonanense]|uniref:Uncharacterized protein n=1 Tax=Flavobacterium cheonanense TaxID=706183 RepID=A0ABP7VVX1_9FLAO